MFKNALLLMMMDFLMDIDKLASTRSMFVCSKLQYFSMCLLNPNKFSSTLNSNTDFHQKLMSTQQWEDDFDVELSMHP